MSGRVFPKKIYRDMEVLLYGECVLDTLSFVSYSN